MFNDDLKATMPSDHSSAVQSLKLSETDSTGPNNYLAATNEKTGYMHYGSLTSQYDTLPASVTTLVEQASLLCRVRMFPDCHTTFNLIDINFRRHPVVAYEEFLVHWAQWRLAESVGVLETAMEGAEESGNDTEDAGLYTLLRVALAKAELFTKGDFAAARQSMREIRNWLQGVDIVLYTDLQVACLAHYYFLILAIPQVTGSFDPLTFRQIPLAAPEVDLLNITQLRQAMQAKRRIRNARLILSFEVGFLPDELAKQAACRSLIEALPYADEHEPVWAVESAVRSMLAQSLRRAGKVVEADEETQLALNLLKHAPVASERNKAHLMIRLDQMKATPFANSKESFRSWTQFAQEDLIKEDLSILLWCLEKIAEATLETLQADPSIENKALFWQCQRRYESLLQDLGDVYFLYMSQTALSLFDELGPSIKMHEEFHTQYPNFALWTLMIAGKRTLALLHVRIGQQDQVLKIFSEISDLMRRQEAFWTENSPAPEQDDAHDVRMHGPSKKDGSLFADMMGTEWFSDWVDTGYVGLGREVRDFPVALRPGLPKGVNPFMSTLLDWLQRAVTKRELSAAEQRCILDIAQEDDITQEADLAATFQRMEPDTLKVRLYGHSDNPTALTRWEAVYAIFEDWLFHRVNDIETKRHILLGALQTEMLDSLVSTTRYTDIVESAKKILDLVPRLNEEAIRHFEGRKVNWRNVACLARKTQLAEEDSETLWNEQSPGFCEVLDMYKVSLKECRERGHLMNEAATLFFMAQHYHQGAMLLRPAAFTAFSEYLDAANTVFDKSRESWKVLEGWAKVEKLLSAVQEQLRLTIAPLLTSVLCQLPNEEVRAQTLWATIQLAKSNGLGWLMQTNDVAESKHAEDSNRVDVDYEELPTLTPEELSSISTDAGGNVCYVDWYNGSSPGTTLIYPIIVSITPDGKTRADTVSMTWTEIDEIVDKVSFDESDLRKEDALPLFQRLNPLIEPLATITEPGQTLVFSSIGSLHRLPLHALAIAGELLIKRNPVVYCSSFTVLNSAFKKRKAIEATQAPDPKDSLPFRASLLGDPPSQPGKKALRTLAQKFSTSAQTGDASTSFNLTAALLDPKLNLLHYHGHATFEEGAPKDHGLELDDRRFTLRDIFDLELDPRPHSRGHHITLLGCGSGMSKTSLSNDVLGLVPAFLYSGASSTVSTLWPFDDKDATMYTREFYRDFERDGMVDLAKANQRATLAIMEKRPALYHWGSFVVNGYWMLKVG
ncbi:MAG: hypothetical protein Q9194_002315 [Teloschistes cf. exilis]